MPNEGQFRELHRATVTSTIYLLRRELYFRRRGPDVSVHQALELGKIFLEHADQRP